jgi:hypothetical protein
MTKHPIETAPKDGTFVLLFGGRTDEEAEHDVTEAECTRPVVAKWEANDGYAGGGWVFAAWECGWRSSYENPTHWMELPE